MIPPLQHHNKRIDSESEFRQCMQLWHICNILRLNRGKVQQTSDAKCISFINGRKYRRLEKWKFCSFDASAPIFSFQKILFSFYVNKKKTHTKIVNKFWLVYVPFRMEDSNWGQQMIIIMHVPVYCNILALHHSLQTHHTHYTTYYSTFTAYTTSNTYTVIQLFRLIYRMHALAHIIVHVQQRIAFVCTEHINS